MLVRFEDLIGPEHVPIVERLFNHCDIRMPRAALEEVLHTHSFEKLSGRRQGQEDAAAHYRKKASRAIGGITTRMPRLQARFAEVAGDLLALWNYA